ncbi:MAG: hypothetical protein LC135_01765 [Phycisphaerae bacterium]|jgi:hypothetical protein|nr:hypothetical protein [Phycisphaerae bacterium]MCZ2398580.1 hypothetical protein [Phycisphaerae bacterium]NUQ49060.1 hypothetical protein [Phycisphaerae bacterium]
MKAVRDDVDRTGVEAILATMERESARYREGGAAQLAAEVRRDLTGSSWRTVSDGTTEHLSKWCHPHRNAEREQTLARIARNLSAALFHETVMRRPGV